MRPAVRANSHRLASTCTGSQPQVHWPPNWPIAYGKPANHPPRPRRNSGSNPSPWPGRQVVTACVGHGDVERDSCWPHLRRSTRIGRPRRHVVRRAACRRCGVRSASRCQSHGRLQIHTRRCRSAGPWGRVTPRWSRLLTGAPHRWRRSPRQWPRCLGRAPSSRWGRRCSARGRARVAVDAGTGGIGIAEVPAAIGDGAGAVASRWAVGDDRVLQRHRAAAVVDAAAAEIGAIAGEGAVAHGQRAAVVDAAARRYALLPEKVLLLTVSAPLQLTMPPPYRRYCRRRCCCSRSACRHRCCRCRRRRIGAIAGEGAVAHGQLCRQSLSMPPPRMSALLPEKVLLLTVSVPPLTL